MPTLYNRIQRGSLERLAALSDGIFAAAMTLLVLDQHLPTVAQVHGERELLAGNLGVSGRFELSGNEENANQDG